MATVQHAKNLFVRINERARATDQKHEFTVEFERRLYLFWLALKLDLGVTCVEEAKAVSPDTLMGERAEEEFTHIKRWIYKRDPYHFQHFRDA